MQKRELEAATELAREAGRMLLEIYAHDFAVDWKGAADPVTEADRKANAFLVRELTARFPQDGIVAEENVAHGDALERERTWFVDPLDGTKEFIAKNGEFSVMLGLAQAGRAVLGVVYQPVGDKLYRGVVGAEAVLEEAGVQRTLVVSEIADPAALRLVVSRSHRSQKTDRVIERLGITHEQASGSVGLKIGRIVEQHADLYVHMSKRSSKWDACAPEAILHAAGGRFRDLLGNPIDYREPVLQNVRGLLACNAAAYATVAKAIAAIARESGYGEHA